MATHPEVNPEALRALVFKDGHSVTTFAEKVGMTRGHLSNVMAGRRGCKPQYIKRMAEELAVPISALLWKKDEAA
jgi:transcriptional regulator with XRE-family HTH domain